MPAPRQRPAKGVQDIRTISGMVDRTAIPSQAFLRVACLEMENERRGRERESAMARVRNIDARALEIEAEKTLLLEALGVQSGAPRGVRRPSPSRASGGLTLRY